MTLLLHRNTSDCGVSGLSPNTQALSSPRGAAGGAVSCPVSASIGCSGQMPVSTSAKITRRPASDWPPERCHGLLEPKNCGPCQSTVSGPTAESASGWYTASDCTAATPG